MKKVFAILLTSILFISCSTPQEIKSISTAELKVILEAEKVQLLDVRTAPEIKQGFIETALFCGC